MKRWYVVQTHSVAEEKAEFNLKAQGYATYLPRYRKKRSHARRVDWVGKPLFPRYLFVELDAETTQWRAVRSTIGVSHFLCSGERPVPVPTGIVENIKTREDNEGYVSMLRHSRFSKGETVEITDGPLAEVSAVFDCLHDNDRVTVLMNLMGRQARVRVPLEALRATA